MEITPVVREVITQQIKYLDKGIEQVTQDISWCDHTRGEYQMKLDELTAKRVELAKFLGVVF